MDFNFFMVDFKLTISAIFETFSKLLVHLLSNSVLIEPYEMITTRISQKLEANFIEFNESLQLQVRAL